MIRIPAVVPPISAIAPTTQKMPSTHSSVSSTSEVGRPVTIVSPGRVRVQPDDAVAAEPVEVDGLGVCGSARLRRVVALRPRH